MKYKFNPQTGILVAGMLAATYASACFYQQTDALCFASGNQVDTIIWDGDGNTCGTTLSTAPVYASSDWWVNANGSSGYFTFTAPTTAGNGPFATRTLDNGCVPDWCAGPAHFNDFSGHSTSINSWVANSAVGGSSGYNPAGVLPQQVFSTYVNLASGSNSGTCQP